ncbi:MAG: esterase family protein [Longimicrobiaceae bacterium]
MLNREYHAWFSPHLHREMELLVFGHAGARMLVFPTSQGRYYEWEDRGMIEALGEHLRNGWLQLFCVDSVDAESWYAEWKHLADRTRRHSDYERYLLAEVLPLTRNRNGNPFLITAGASFGAYHAANLAFRHPALVNRMIGLSGLYDIRQLTGGYSDPDVYFNNPQDFVANERDPGRLEALRRMDIILATGSDDRFRTSNEQLSTTLWDKGIGNALRIWDGWAHDWPWWREMITAYVGGQR